LDFTEDDQNLTCRASGETCILMKMFKLDFQSFNKHDCILVLMFQDLATPGTGKMAVY